MTPFAKAGSAVLAVGVALLVGRPIYHRFQVNRDAAAAAQVMDLHVARMQKITGQRMLALGQRLEARARQAGLCGSFATTGNTGCRMTPLSDTYFGSTKLLRHDDVQRRVQMEFRPGRTLFYEIPTPDPEHAAISIFVWEIPYTYEYDGGEGQLYFFTRDDRRRQPVTEAFYRTFKAEHGITLHEQSLLRNYLSLASLPPFPRAVAQQLLGEGGFGGRPVSCPPGNQREKATAPGFELWCYVWDINGLESGPKSVRLDLRAIEMSVSAPLPFLN